RHTRSKRDWSSDVCSSDLLGQNPLLIRDDQQVEVVARSDEARGQTEIDQRLSGALVGSYLPVYMVVVRGGRFRNELLPADTDMQYTGVDQSPREVFDESRRAELCLDELPLRRGE